MHGYPVDLKYMNPFVEIVRKYFLSPMWNRTGYNWVNTLAYGVILGIAAVIVYRYLKRRGYRFGIDLFVMFLPYLVFATTVRVLVDAGTYPYTYLLISPGIYFTTMGIFSACILLALLIRRVAGIQTPYTVVLAGSILAATQLAILMGMITQPWAGVFILAVSTGVCGAVLGLRRLVPALSTVIGSRENVMVLCCHLVDATVTFIGVDFYGYAEQHVLPRTLISLTGTAAVMYLLKIALVPLILYLLDRYVDDRDLNMFVKIVIMVLGLAPATRNSLRIMVAS